MDKQIAGQNTGLEVLGVGALSSGLTMLQTDGDLVTGAVIAAVGIGILTLKYLKRD